MLHEFLEVIRSIGYPSEFESYCMSLQRKGLSGAPTADEAREDYRVATLSKVALPYS